MGDSAAGFSRSFRAPPSIYLVPVSVVEFVTELPPNSLERRENPASPAGLRTAVHGFLRAERTDFEPPGHRLRRERATTRLNGEGDSNDRAEEDDGHRVHRVGEVVR